MFHFVDMPHWHNVAFLVLAPSQTISVVVEPWIIIFLSKMIGITFLFCSHVRLRSYMELCILVPGISTHGSGSSEQVSTETPLSANQPLVELIWSCTASMLLLKKWEINEQIVALFHVKCSDTLVYKGCTNPEANLCYGKWGGHLAQAHEYCSTWTVRAVRVIYYLD